MSRVVFALQLPHDPMTVERLRRVVRSVALGARTAFLAPALLLRRRLRRPPRQLEIRRILVVRTDRLGDMALTTPALADLRAHFRRAEITVLAPAGPLQLLEAHPAVDQRIALPERGAPDGLTGRFDLAIDFMPDASLRAARIVAATAAPVRAGFRGGGREVLFNLPGPRVRRGLHLIDLNRRLLEALGVTPATNRPVLHVTPDELENARARLAALGAAGQRVAIHPGGRHPSQQWAPERYAEVVTALTIRSGLACLVLEGPADVRLADRLCAATPDALRPGALGVRGLMAMIAVCDLFIGGNSGPLHIAGALGIPTVSVMGPSDPARFWPRGVSDRVVRHDLPCSPCGRGRCWHHTCLRSIDPEEVVELADQAMGERLARREAL